MHDLLAFSLFTFWWLGFSKITLIEHSNSISRIVFVPQVVLQAAHIQPYQGWQSNAVQNGILLRSDLHLLFDSHYATLKYENGELIFLVHPSIYDEFYRSLDRKRAFLPEESKYWPCKKFLECHNQEFTEKIKRSTDQDCR